MSTYSDEEMKTMLQSWKPVDSSLQDSKRSAEADSSRAPLTGSESREQALLRKGWRKTAHGMWLDYLGRGMWTLEKALELAREREATPNK